MKTNSKIKITTINVLTVMNLVKLVTGKKITTVNLVIQEANLKEENVSLEQ